MQSGGTEFEIKGGYVMSKAAILPRLILQVVTCGLNVETSVPIQLLCPANRSRPMGIVSSCCESCCTFSHLS